MTGGGRNAGFLASRGFRADAVDLSPDAIAWTGDRAREAAAEVGPHGGEAFRPTRDELVGPYDLVVVSGSFPHLPPHRRTSHLRTLDRVLAVGGHPVLAAFAARAPGSGSPVPDAELYREGKPSGGLAHTPQDPRWIFEGLTEAEVRALREQPADPPLRSPVPAGRSVPARGGPAPGPVGPVPLRSSGGTYPYPGRLTVVHR
ncbi:class I SAM-dependent methyltransferase [Kitasatospora cineracea]